MAKVFELLADGFEEIEALMPVDVLRRGGVDVQTVSIMPTADVKGAHGVGVRADLTFDQADFSEGDMVLLPGGMPGAANLDSHEGVHSVLTQYAEQGRYIGAICAAPLVLGRMGLLRGRNATCYPGFEKYLDGANVTSELVTVDGNIVTGRGPAAATSYAFKLLSFFASDHDVHEVAAGMGYFWK